MKSVVPLFFVLGCGQTPVSFYRVGNTLRVDWCNNIEEKSHSAKGLVVNMKLPVGARLPHDFADIPANEPDILQRNRSLYRVTQVLHETAWSCLYRGKKVFRNFEFTKGLLSEAGDDECLDVLIRTLSYPTTDDREYVRQRRDHAKFEAQRVLGSRCTNLIAEPLDYLELRNEQDQFAFPRAGKMASSEPVLVFETIQGDNLARWRQSVPSDLARVMSVVGQTLQFLDTMHVAGFLLNVFSPVVFWVDRLDRAHFLGTENVVDAGEAAAWRGLFPPERYAQGFLAPELLDPDAAPSGETDLFGWAATAWMLLTGDSPAKLATEQQQRSPRFEGPQRERLRHELLRLPEQRVADVQQALNVTGSRFASLWPDSVIDGLWTCLDPNPAQRPRSVAELRKWWGNPPPPPVPACLVLRRANGTARVAFSTRGLPDGLQFQIVRQFAPVSSSILSEALPETDEMTDSGEPVGVSPRTLDRRVRGLTPTGSPRLQNWTHAQPLPDINLPSTEAIAVWKGTTTKPVEITWPAPPGVRRGSSPSLPDASRYDWCFSVQTVESHQDAAGVSRAVVAATLSADTPGFRRCFAESLGEAARLDLPVGWTPRPSDQLGGNSDGRGVHPTRGTSDRAACPEQIWLLTELDSTETVAIELLDSTEPRVRGWAISLLEQHVQGDAPDSVCRTLIETRGLTDPEYDVRLHAAGALLRTAVAIDVPRVVELAQRLGGDAVDDMIRAARSLLAFGVPPLVLDRAIESLEAQHRIVVCPACQQELRARELDPHLTSQHHYIPLDGKLLPFGQALTRLWSRVLYQCDSTALQTLVAQLRQRHPDGVTSAFATALSQQVLLALPLHLAQQSELQRQQWIERLAEGLRSELTAKSAGWQLLAHDDSRVRRLGREMVLPDVALRLADEFCNVTLLRKAIEQLVPVEAARVVGVESSSPQTVGSTVPSDDAPLGAVEATAPSHTGLAAHVVTERIEVCQRLLALGANRLACEQALREIELERLVDCPECGTTFPKRDLAKHRRTTHRIYEWEGTRYEFDPFVDLLVSRTVSVDADPFAARNLAELFVEQFGEQSHSLLFVRLRDALSQFGDCADGLAVAEQLGAAMGGVPQAMRLMKSFLKKATECGRVVALSMFCHWDEPPAVEVTRAVAAQLGRAELPFGLCQEVAVVLLRRSQMDSSVSTHPSAERRDYSSPDAPSAGPGDDPSPAISRGATRSQTPPDICRSALLELASRAGDRLQGIDLLRGLEQWTGPSTILDEVCVELESKIRLRCPRCEARLSPRELAEHVQSEHGLVLEGRAVRQPWSVALESLDAYATDPRQEWLDYAEAMAVLASPESGRKRLLREALQRGVAPAHYRQELLDSTKGTSNSLCPQCWGAVPASESSPGDVRIDARGNITSKDITLQRIGLHGLWGSVAITPWSGTLPGWSLSRWGAVVAVALLFLVPAALCGWWAWNGFVAAQALALGSLSGGVVAIVAVLLCYWPRTVEPVDVAWEQVVPAMLDEPLLKLGPDHSSFFASLARASCGRGSATARWRVVDRTITVVSPLTRQGLLPLRHLTELLRLQFDDAGRLTFRKHARGEVVRDWIGQALRGTLPLKSLDESLRNGASLVSLRPDEVRASVWHLVSEAASLELTPADATALCKASSTFGSLLKTANVSVPALAHCFAMLERERSESIPDRLVTTRQLIADGQHKLTDDRRTSLARTVPSRVALFGDETVRLKFEAFEFRGNDFTYLPDIRVKENRTFVQTGWTHPRQDGGPDMRFAVNPPIGHYVTTGFSLCVGSWVWDHKSDPTPLAEDLRQFADFYFQQLKPRAEELSRQPTTARLASILIEPAPRCPHCQTPLRLKKGSLAERLPEPVM